MKLRNLLIASLILGTIASMASFTLGAPAGTHAARTFKVALSMSYTGNDWQSDAANLIKAEAKSPPYNHLINLRVDIAGTDVTRQIQTINNEVAAGMNAIIVYPLSPTALNPTITAACRHGVVVFAYDSLITAPCAYNVHDDITDLGYRGGLWVAGQLHRHHLHNLALITGVSGTSADQEELDGVHEALKKFPDVHIVASASGKWDQALIKTAFASELASHPDINGVWGITGCQPILEDLQSQGKKPIYCSGGGTNAERVLMLPKAMGGKGAQDFSVGAPPYDGELAFIQAVQVLEGKKVAHDTIMPTPIYVGSQIRMGTNPKKGANVFPPKLVTPGLFDDFWSPLVEQGLQAVLHGTPDKISNAKSCSQVPGCRQQSHLTFNKLHPGGN